MASCSKRPEYLLGYHFNRTLAIKKSLYNNIVINDHSVQESQWIMAAGGTMKAMEIVATI